MGGNMEVKVVNLRSNTFSHDFTDSIISTGFAVITHHGIDHGLIKEAQAVWRSFFNQKRSYKDQFVNVTDSNMGFVGFGNEKAVGAQVEDIKEFFHWKPGQQIPSEVAFITQKLYSLLEGDLAGQLLHALNYNESIPMDFVEACRNSDSSVLRALYYPALQDIKVEPGAIRAAAHEDIDFLSLLVAASAPGLQVRDNEGNWHDVPFEENSITVNVGDQLQLASNGLFKSTTHRVINPDSSSADRISIPLFLHANSDTMLAPGITAQQYLHQRLNEIYKEGYK
jgi:isopenicillin N synthase-like dioxygenase